MYYNKENSRNNNKEYEIKIYEKVNKIIIK